MLANLVVADPLTTTLQAHRLLFLKKIGLRICIVLPAMWLIALVLFALAKKDPLAYITLTLAFFVTILPPIAFFSTRRLLKKAFHSIPGGAYTYEIDELGVSWHSPIGGSQVNWQGFTRAC